MDLFTVKCHHYNITVLFLVQNVFPPGKYARTLSLNAHYICLFATKRDALQIQSLGRQISPGQNAYFMEAYHDATTEAFGYLLCNLHPRTDKLFQLSTHIFPNENMWVYTPLKKASAVEQDSVSGLDGDEVTWLNKKRASSNPSAMVP